MLIFRSRSSAIIRIPTLAVMLAGVWGLIEVTRLAGTKHSLAVTGGFAVVVCSALALGGRVFRRVGDAIVSTGLLGSRQVPARQAVLGVRMRGAGKYWGLDLDLMAHGNFESRDAITLDSFTPNGTQAVMAAARRASTLLGLPEPILAPGLPGVPGRTADTPAGGDAPERFDIRARWRATSPWAKFLGAMVLASVGWIVGAAFLHPGGKLLLICAQPWPVRDPAPTFSFTCQGRTVIDVDAGPSTLAVWDRQRGCWTEQRLSVPARRRLVVDVDRAVKVAPCSTASWPPP